MKMKDLLCKAYRLTVLSSIICFLLGFLVFLEADLAVKFMAILIGSILILVGVLVTIRYFADGTLRFFFGYSLMYSLLDIVAGIAMILNPNVMYVILSVFIAINLFVEFVSKLEIGMIFKKYEINGWLFQFILAAILLISAIIIIVNPTQGTLVITKVISVIIMSVALINLVDSFIIREKAKRATKSIKDILE